MKNDEFAFMFIIILTVAVVFAVVFVFWYAAPEMESRQKFCESNGYSDYDDAELYEELVVVKCCNHAFDNVSGIYEVCEWFLYKGGLVK